MILEPEQWAFLQDDGRLIQWFKDNGYEATEGEGLRTPAQAWINSLPADSKLKATAPDGTSLIFSDPVGGVGKSQSLHILKLAKDYNLFKDGVIMKTVDDFRPAGEYWKLLHPYNRWGGDFGHPRPDAYHFERNVPGII